MNTSHPYKDFTDRLKLLIRKHPDLMTTLALPAFVWER